MSNDKGDQTPDPAGDQSAEKICDSTEFKLYLDAVNAGSQRTRSNIYVLVAIVVITLTAYRNTNNPDWINSRLANFQLASACLGKGEPFTTECKQAIDYSRGFLFSGREHELFAGPEFKAELTEQINALIKMRTEALSLRLPFFGVVIDMNDLGMLTGIFLGFVLYVLHAGLSREVDNLERSTRKARTGEGKPLERLELLLMTQVLASRKGVTIGVHILLLLAVLVHGAVVRIDVATYRTAAVLQGSGWAFGETLLDVLMFVTVLVLAVLCWRGQRALDDKVDDLIEEVTKLEVEEARKS